MASRVSSSITLARTQPFRDRLHDGDASRCRLRGDPPGPNLRLCLGFGFGVECLGFAVGGLCLGLHHPDSLRPQTEQATRSGSLAVGAKKKPEAAQRVPVSARPPEIEVILGFTQLFSKPPQPPFPRSLGKGVGGNLTSWHAKWVKQRDFDRRNSEGF